MKQARMCGLVVLSFLIAVLWSAQALGFDHPWDGTKISDTLRMTGTIGGHGSGDKSISGGGQSSWFPNWLIGPSQEDPAVKEAMQSIKNKATKSQVKKSISFFARFFGKK